MRIIQNGYNYADSSQNYHEFFICTHKYHPFRKTSESGWNHPPSCLGKYIIVNVHLSCRTFTLGGFRSVVRIAPTQMTGSQMPLSNHAQMGVVAPDRGGVSLICRVELKFQHYSVTVPTIGHGYQSGQASAADRVESGRDYYYTSKAISPRGYSSFGANAIRLSSGIRVSWLRVLLVLWLYLDLYR